MERCLTYGARAITAQTRSGDWDYHYMPVISIAFTNFTLPNFKGQTVVDGSLTDTFSGKQMTDRLRLIFLQLPEFKEEDPQRCQSGIEQWLYTIKNMKTMDHIPFATKKPIFKRVESGSQKYKLFL